MSRLELLELLAPWWEANGWSLERLRRMPRRQLYAIARRAAASGWYVKRRLEQLKLFE